MSKKQILTSVKKSNKTKNKMKKYTILLFTIAISVIVLLSACSDGNVNTDVGKNQNNNEQNLLTDSSNKPNANQNPTDSSVTATEPIDEPTSDIALPPIDVSVGDRITFGDYIWRVLDVADGRALILTEDIIALRPFHDTIAFVSWATSDIRTYLNGEFLDKFDTTERARISETTLTNSVNPWFYGSDVRPYLTDELLRLFEETDPAQFAEIPTNDFVFLLSLDELVHYFGDSGQLENPPEDALWWLSDEYDGERVARVASDMTWEGGTFYTGDAWMWWLRTHGYDISSVVVFPDGVLGMNGANVFQWDVGLRPAMWLDLN